MTDDNRDQDAPNQSDALPADIKDDRGASTATPPASNVNVASSMGTMSGVGYGQGPAATAGLNPPDSRIEEEVSWLLQSMEFVNSDDLQVSVKDGAVTLRGTVSLPQALQMVEERVGLIAGVTSIHNELQLKQ